MILAEQGIKRAVSNGEITITPFIVEHVEPNSYDVRLGDTLLELMGDTLDARVLPQYKRHHIGDDGFLLMNGILYLGSTIECTASNHYVMELAGRSSIGRLGLSVHITAGLGDVGFGGHWTMELTTVKPIRVYAGMRIAQIVFHEVRYPTKLYSGKYQGQIGPVGSLLFMDTVEPADTTEPISNVVSKKVTRRSTNRDKAVEAHAKLVNNNA